MRYRTETPGLLFCYVVISCACVHAAEQPPARRLSIFSSLVVDSIREKHEPLPPAYIPAQAKSSGYASSVFLRQLLIITAE